MNTTVSGDLRDSNSPRKVVMHVNFADAEQLNSVLNNVENIYDFYDARAIEVEIHVVCHGPGLNMLREDISPVKERLIAVDDKIQKLTFVACSNTIDRVTKAQGKRPEVLKLAKIVPAGLPEIIELQRSGWIYIKP